MGRAGGQARASNDFWAEKAKHDGYPARSVYKLEEILTKTSLITKQALVLDLGAAPGSWSLFLSRVYQARVISCDLKPLQLPQKPKNITMVQGDFFTDEIMAKLQSYAPFAAVVCDAAPSTTGDRLVDCGRSYHLAARSLEMARLLLQPGGGFITKMFAGGDEQELITLAKSYFTSVKIMRPKAVRKESFEFYIVGKGFIAQTQDADSVL